MLASYYYTVMQNTRPRGTPTSPRVLAFAGRAYVHTRANIRDKIRLGYVAIAIGYTYAHPDFDFFLLAPRAHQDH
jgi:hypothetical protein